jgi:hypothetical protein
MKNLACLILSLLAAKFCFAQQTITVNFSKNTVEASPRNLTTTQTFDIVVADYGALKSKNVQLTLTSGTTDVPDNFQSSKHTEDLKKLFGQQPAGDLTLNLLADKTNPHDLAYNINFKIDGKGAIIFGAIPTPVDPSAVKPDPAAVAVTPVKPYSVDFFDPKLINKKLKNDPYNLIVFNPCGPDGPSYTIKSLGETKNFLRYRGHENGKSNGVVFRIDDFNVPKYDITVTNQFNNTGTDAAPLFQTVFDLVSKGAGTVSSDQPPLLVELSKFVKLNADLKKYLDSIPDCGMSAVAVAKDTLLARTKRVFELKGSDLDITENYVKLKNQFLKQPNETEDTWNSKTQKEYGVIADTLVNQTKVLFNQAFKSSYQYEYIIPMIENADALSFTVNIKPKSGNNGLTITNAPINIPIHGGLKVDFTTGIYYSSIRNNSYVLKASADSSHMLITNEGKAKGTLGINALMHIYSRLGDVSPTAVLGVGKSIDLNYSFLLGAGIAFGHDDRFAISGGFNYSNIKTLSNKYIGSDGAPLPLPKTATDITTYNVFKWGKFISFTYSLGLNKKTQTAASGSTPSTDSGSSTAAPADNSSTKASGKTKN